MRPRHTADELLVLASDGLWDVVHNDDMIDVAQRLEVGGSVRGVCEELAEQALQKGSRDNITLLLINLKGTMK